MKAHADDQAVDSFAAAMKAKMADARSKGRGGWEDREQCTAEDLSRMLRDHVEKGDPRDVANFCMMLWNRKEGIAATGKQQVGEVQGDCRSPNEMADALERIAGGALSDYEGVEADELHLLRCAKLIRDLAANGAAR